MKSIMTLALIGISSSIAFADGGHDQGRQTRFDYKCRFEQERDDGPRAGDEGLKCWVSGSFCQETDWRGQSKRCESREDPIRIRCSNGFRLASRDAAVRLDDGNLWINASKEDRIATLRVEELFRDISALDTAARRDADLLVSDDENGSQRLAGACRFEKNEGDDGDQNGDGHQGGDQDGDDGHQGGDDLR